MALIPRAVKNMIERLVPERRSSLVMIQLGDAEEQAALPQPAKEIVAAEAIQPQLFSLTSGDGEDPAFRRITSLPTLRDLNPMMHDRMQQVCYYLRVTTPFGKRIVEIITSYSVGKGVRITATDPKVQDVIEKFWNDDINKMDETLPVWCDELTTFGELCVPFARRDADGFVRIGYVDPMDIEGIRFAEMDTAMGTAALSIPFGVQLRREIGDALPKVMPIVRRSEDINDPAFGRLQGECFYHTINKAKSASRGFSELFSLADWIDVFDQMMFDFADKVRLLNAFVWHYTLPGADDKQVEEFQKKLTRNPPRQGGVQVTNDKVQIESRTPDFKGNDMSQVAGMLKSYGLGGAGLPKIFFADGEDANRASALEMNAPAVKKFQDRQNNMAALLNRVIGYVIDSAILAGVLPESVNTDFTVEFPEIVVRDLQRGAQTLQGLSVALSAAAAEGWIQSKTAARCFHTLMAEIGCDIDDSGEEYDAAQQEMQERQRENQNRFAPQSGLADALKQIGTDQVLPEPTDSEVDSEPVAA